jgi:histone-binding protein RBBP4
MGTHTSDDEQNYLMLAEVRLPGEDAEVEGRKYDDEKGEVGGFGGVSGKVDIVKRINHDGEVNRARYMPQNPLIVATKTVSSEVYIFDTSKHPRTPAENTGCNPEHRCHGHEREGYGLCWNPHKAGQLISGSDDALICFWDMNGGGAKLDAARVFKYHTDVIEDVSWHMQNEHLFGSCADDRCVAIWDVRKDKPAQTVKDAHEKEINCLSFNPFCEHLLATGSADNMVHLWDTRSLGQKLHAFKGHDDEVFQVQWNAENQSILASCGADRRVNIWDLSKVCDLRRPC